MESLRCKLQNSEPHTLGPRTWLLGVLDGAPPEGMAV